LAVSFPALLVALSVPRRGFNPTPVIAQVIAGAPLAELAKAARIPLWLRKFAPESFARAIPRLPNDPDFCRRIVNHLPRSPKLAPAWIDAVANTAEWGDETLAVWIARHLVRDTRRADLKALRLISLWAWFSVRPDTHAYTLSDLAWTPAMQFKAATTTAGNWWRAVNLYANLGDATIADMWTAPATIDGYEFMPLRTFEDITQEACAMSNCVRSYADKMAHNHSRLWSVRKGGERVATLDIAYRYRDPLPNVFQLKASRNREAPCGVWWAARRWVHMHDLPGLATNRLDWNAAPLDQAVWTKLWKPYWLAKRRIPDWLPLGPSRYALGDLAP
jgi:hypothetical protein